MKRINILGSTGSIGTSTLAVVRDYPEAYRVNLLLAGSNVILLEEQIHNFRPAYAAIADPVHAGRLREFLGDRPATTFLSMEDALQLDCDVAVSAIVGTAGLMPTWHAIHHADRVALANKESLVAGGELICRAAGLNGTELIPVDSEHSAIHQAMRSGEDNEVAELILTASGGPFRGLSAEDLRTRKAADALQHPTWSMGDKVTIDSATLMNKGLEVIEAHFLFDMDYDRIRVKVHPQSIVHSMVAFRDGSVLAQLGATDMRLPILYALAYPERPDAPSLELAMAGEFSFDFHDPDTGIFRCLELAYQAGRGTLVDRIVLNAANEVAVHAFLKDHLSFSGIPDFIENMLETVNEPVPVSVEEIAALDVKVKELAQLEVTRGCF